MAKEKQEKSKERMRGIISRLMPFYSEAEYGLPYYETMWRQQALVYASNESLSEKKQSFNHLLEENDKVCVLVFDHNDIRRASNMYPAATGKAMGGISRIFSTADGPWTEEKSVIFSKYWWVLCIDPPDTEPLRELANVMGDGFGHITDLARFIVNRTSVS